MDLQGCMPTLVVVCCYCDAEDFFIIYSFFKLNFQFNLIMESQLNTLSSKVLSQRGMQCPVALDESSIVAKRI